jgi:hypothetical protein
MNTQPGNDRSHRLRDSRRMCSERAMRLVRVVDTGVARDTMRPVGAWSAHRRRPG